MAVFFLFSSVAAVLQNILGVGLARALGLDPLLGIVAGSIALTGGPATALAFGPTFESMGVAGATTLGVASGMFGITTAGLLGGFIGGSLIRKHGLSGPPAQGQQPSEAPTPPASSSPSDGRTDRKAPIPVAGPAQPDPGLPARPRSEASPLFKNVTAVSIAMGLGTLISAWLENRGITLPPYVGAMIFAALMRNLDDRLGWLGIEQHHVDTIANISLHLFIVMAMLTLRLWELAHLALPTLMILAAQVVLVWLLCVTASFYLMGRDYESAVMASGFCGFMLGTTANAVACMDLLVHKYGLAPKAFIIVPLVGAFLIDLANAVIISGMATWLR
jgi:ESS family glutamate:Na+ symporter